MQQLGELNFLWISHSELRQNLKMKVIFPYFLLRSLILHKNFPIDIFAFS